ncbi:M24 family metallopeptidase [Terracidiphilus gabretensis]|uniref:M24 family metallopeptidase n=1 Tax=Terracidiphilus gabretensis TaxID=1577687 RepID=UPI00071BBB6C|nr:Xaa-Pro peptidase family protein [Terracidiphilus gabretensis]
MSFSRRRFLSTTAGAAFASSAAPLALAHAESSMVQSQSQSWPEITSLPKLAGQSRPFTNAERLARIDRAKTLMAANKIDAIVLTGGTSSVYFADLRLYGSERLWALVIPAKAKPFLVVPAFEEDRAREILDAGPFGKNADILTWQEDENPFALVGKGLRDRGISTGTVGVDENTKFVFADSIRAANSHLTIVSATPVTAGCRMVKDAHEIECMRLACKATLLVYRAVARSVHPGMTNADVEKLVDLGYRQVGFRGDASLNIDEFTALPHGSPKPQTLKDGSILMLDDGCVVEGYTSDITRTFVLGKATDKMKKVFDLVKAAQTAALKTARPGVVTGDVDAAARKVIVDGGYGPAFTYFTHRVGHGIGMDMHEWPYFVKNDMYGWDLAPKLKAGMTLSDEPGVYIKGEFGVRLEDDLLVTENGAELLTPQSPSIEDPFGGMGY